jgi:hypothetical protein
MPTQAAPGAPGGLQNGAGLPPGGAYVGQTPAAAITAADQAKADAELKAKLPQAQTATQALNAKGDMVKNFIDQAINHIQTNGGTGLASLVTGIPGSPARHLKDLLDGVRSNIGFEEMAQLRDESPTGASGLARVTQQEMYMLQSVLGSLDQGQTADQLVGNLNQIKTILSDATKARNDAFQSAYGPLIPKAAPPHSGASSQTPAPGDVEAEMKRRGLIK